MPALQDTITRLAGLSGKARSYSDTTYSGAVDAADPGEVRAADDVPSARALVHEFLRLADGLAEAGADADDLGDALDLVTCEAEVEDEARRVERAERHLQDCREHLQRAQHRLDSAEGPAEKARAESAVRAAEAEVQDAMRKLRQAMARLQEALSASADQADVLRRGLQTRHGGIHEAAQKARGQMAETPFYADDGQIGRPATDQETEDSRIGEPAEGSQ